MMRPPRTNATPDDEHHDGNGDGDDDDDNMMMMTMKMTCNKSEELSSVGENASEAAVGCD